MEIAPSRYYPKSRRKSSNRVNRKPGWHCHGGWFDRMKSFPCGAVVEEPPFATIGFAVGRTIRRGVPLYGKEKHLSVPNRNRRAYPCGCSGVSERSVGGKPPHANSHFALVRQHL